MAGLEASLALEAAGDGLWRGRASPDHEANTGMFGGWTAALLAHAVLSDPKSEGSLSAINVNYLNRVPPGAALSLRTSLIGGGRSLSHWRADLALAEDGALVATAMVTLANRRETLRFTEKQMPAAAAPETLAEFHPPGKFGATTEVRGSIGANCFNLPSTRSLAWQRDTTGRRIDAVQLIYLSDVGWPRIFALSDGPRPSSTVIMSVYVHAAAEELAACGDDYILCDMIGTRIEQATVGSQADLWSRNGALLATTTQLCWFR